jgi:predicted glycosyltransferase involved in capsule biosynthesis
MVKRTLLNECKHFVESRNLRWPGLVIERSGPVDEGFFYILNNVGFRFGVVLQEFNALKVSFLFFETFTDDEAVYWGSRYKFKLFTDPDKIYNQALSILQVKEEVSDKLLKVIMSRYMETDVLFKKDFRWIIRMGELRGNELCVGK